MAENQRCSETLEEKELTGSGLESSNSKSIEDNRSNNRDAEHQQHQIPDHHLSFTLPRGLYQIEEPLPPHLLLETQKTTFQNIKAHCTKTASLDHETPRKSLEPTWLWRYWQKEEKGVKQEREKAQKQGREKVGVDG